MLYPLPFHKNKIVLTGFLFVDSFGEMLEKFVASAKYQYFNVKMFNICFEDVVSNGNLFGLKIYLRYCDKFNRCNIILMDYGLGYCSKVFRYCTVYVMYLRIFDYFRVYLLKQFMNTNSFVFCCLQGDII